MIAILCKDRREYTTFLRNIDAECQDNFHMVNTVDDVRGVNFNQVIKLRNFWMVDNRDEVEYYANLRVVK